ncbi:MAG: hypothetical protein ACTSVB_08110 [Candidatus Heimdallarchaeaceae archaeon]
MEESARGLLLLANPRARRGEEKSISERSKSAMYRFRDDGAIGI